MQKCLFIVLIFLGVDCCAQDSIFSDWTQTTPGGVVGVVHHGKPVYVKAFGLADIAKKIPNDTSLIFDLASITKQFTGMCIALLEEQGKLSVEDDLKKYYPTSQIPPGIKIKNLLDHTSGLRDAAVLAILSGKMNLSGEVKRKYETTEYYMECFMRENDLNFTPGSELSYTNFNYILLGEIVKKVSGRSLPEFADSAIFRPLGMTKTIFRVQPSQKIPGETKGYLQKGKKYKQRDGRGGIVGDHNLLSTVNDMLKWEMNFLNNQLGQKKPGLIEKVTTGSKLNDGSPTNYGYGVWNMPWKGITHIQHGGDDGRETSFSIVFPDQQLIIVVLSNSSNYDATREKAYRIAKVLLKDDLKEPEKPTRQLDTIRLGEDQLKLREGTYTLVNKKGLASVTRVTYSKPDLYYSHSLTWKGLQLHALSTDSFVVINLYGDVIDVRFQKEAGNDVVIESYLDSTPLPFTRQPKMEPRYADYRGVYRNASTGAVLRVKSRRQKLVARKGIIRIPLVPFNTDEFYAAELDGLFVFRRENGAVRTLKVNASDFRNFVFDRQK